MDNQFVVYRVYNKQTNKSYIGKSKNGGVTRWSDHQKSLKKCKHYNKELQHDWNIYGEDAFDCEILETLETPDKLLDAERKWIHRYRTTGETYNERRPIFTTEPLPEQDLIQVMPK